MGCASGIAKSSSVLVSLRTAFERAASSLGEPADFAFVFVSGDDLAEKADEIMELWKELAPNVPIFGGSAEGVLGQRIELEGQNAASVLLVSGFRAHPKLFELECIRTPDGPSVMGVSEELLEVSHRGLLVIACPVSFSMELLADVLEYERSSVNDPVPPILGGYCSSNDWQSPNLLFNGDHATLKGAVALSLPEGWGWHTVISQGCRPVGESFVITAMDGATVLELGGKPAIEQLRAMYSSLPVQEQRMVSTSLMMGRAINEFSHTFSHGDFLIRAVQGVDSSNQGLVVTDRFQVGQTVSFHVRDAEAADADFRNLLSKSQSLDLTPQGALMFTCNGRGLNMFPSEHHDALVLDEYFRQLPMSGTFAAGEFGPIAGQNLVHGFTVVVNLLIKDVEGGPN